MDSISLVQNTIDTLLAHEKIQKAFDFIDADHDATVEELKEMAVVHGAPFLEGELRSPMFAEKLQRHGAVDTCIDAHSNAFGWVRGGEGPVVALEAHLDTVFARETPLQLVEKDGRLHCPGISDDTAGMATVLAVLRTVTHERLVPAGSWLIGGTTGEEGDGDLRGIKHLLDSHRDIAAVVSLEPGPIENLVYQGAGSRRYEFIFKGPGGHSWQAYGLPSPVHAMSRAVAKIAGIDTVASPKTTYTVGVVSGGTSVNSIALEARCRLDMRSCSPVELDALEKKALAFIDEGVEEENIFRQKSGKKITVERHLIGDRPAGMQSELDTIVQTAWAAVRSMGATPRLALPASTNANAPISRNIPAIVLRTGGTREGNHTLDEWFCPDGSQAGVKLALLVMFALSGLQGVTSPLIPARP